MQLDLMPQFSASGRDFGEIKQPLVSGIGISFGLGFVPLIRLDLSDLNGDGGGFFQSQTRTLLTTGDGSIGVFNQVLLGRALHGQREVLGKEASHGRGALVRSFKTTVDEELVAVMAVLLEVDRLHVATGGVGFVAEHTRLAAVGQCLRIEAVECGRIKAQSLQDHEVRLAVGGRQDFQMPGMIELDLGLIAPVRLAVFRLSRESL